MRLHKFLCSIEERAWGVAVQAALRFTHADSNSVHEESFALSKFLFRFKTNIFFIFILLLRHFIFLYSNFNFYLY